MDQEHSMALLSPLLRVSQEWNQGLGQAAFFSETQRDSFKLTQAVGRI